MTALPVAYYLKELSGEVSRRGGRALGAFGHDGASDIEAQLEEAHARGVLEGRAAAQAEFSAAAEAQAAASEQKLASERQTWASDEGQRLGGLISAGLDDLEQRISNVVGEVLKSFLSEQAKDKAVTELAQSLREMVSKGDYAKIVVSGPADLIEAMEKQIDTGRGGVSFVASSGSDLTVSADETILATRIGAWIDVIKGAGP